MILFRLKLIVVGLLSACTALCQAHDYIEPDESRIITGVLESFPIAVLTWSSSRIVFDQDGEYSETDISFYGHYSVYRFWIDEEDPMIDEHSLYTYQSDDGGVFLKVISRESLFELLFGDVMEKKSQFVLGSKGSELDREALQMWLEREELGLEYYEYMVFASQNIRFFRTHYIIMPIFETVIEDE